MMQVLKRTQVVWSWTLKYSQTAHSHHSRTCLTQAAKRADWILFNLWWPKCICNIILSLSPIRHTRNERPVRSMLHLSAKAPTLVKTCQDENRPNTKSNRSLAVSSQQKICTSMAHGRHFLGASKLQGKMSWNFPHGSAGMGAWPISADSISPFSTSRKHLDSGDSGCGSSRPPAQSLFWRHTLLAVRFSPVAPVQQSWRVFASFNLNIWI